MRTASLLGTGVTKSFVHNATRNVFTLWTANSPAKSVLQLKLFDSGLKHVESFLTQGAAAQLSDPGAQQVHCGALQHVTRAMRKREPLWLRGVTASVLNVH